MENIKRNRKGSNIESDIKKYLKEAEEKLENDLAGTREAIRLIAIDKTRAFMIAMDKGLDKDEREYLKGLIIESMYQSFCYGYGIGKIEGKTDKKLYI
ncbi:MAG: hypothetical protein N3B21_12805 [Clostridia bacterium]|nr:hypothetical protein [Clostridia bacterium]